MAEKWILIHPSGQRLISSWYWTKWFPGYVPSARRSLRVPAGWCTLIYKIYSIFTRFRAGVLEQRHVAALFAGPQTLRFGCVCRPRPDEFLIQILKHCEPLFVVHRMLWSPALVSKHVPAFDIDWRQMRAVEGDTWLKDLIENINNTFSYTITEK